MKLDINNQQHAELIARYLGGDMDGQEYEQFEKQISDLQENNLLIQKMKKQWELMGNYQKPETPDTGKAWEKLYNRLVDNNLVPAQHRNATVSLVPRLIKAAAISLIFVSAGIAAYYGFNRKAAPEMVQINTGNESNTLIKTLADGSIIYLAQHSTFAFPKQFETTTRNVELKGEAFFDISPNPEKPFIIETDEAFIEVLGTAFNVKTANGSNFELLVDRGKIKVTLKGNPSKSEYVVAGEKLVSINNAMIKSKFENSHGVNWYIKSMKFKDEPLQNIINVLNRNFNTTFAVANNEVGNRRLTVTFENESVGTMTDLICLTLNLKCRKTNGSTLLLENKQDSKGN